MSGSCNSVCGVCKQLPKIQRFGIQPSKRRRLHQRLNNGLIRYGGVDLTLSIPLPHPSILDQIDQLETQNPDNFSGVQFQNLEDSERENELYDAMLSEEKPEVQKQLLQQQQLNDMEENIENDVQSSLNPQLSKEENVLQQVNFRHMDIKRYDKKPVKIPAHIRKQDFSNWHRLSLHQILKQVQKIANENAEHPEQHLCIPPEYLCLLYEANLLNIDLLKILFMYDINHMVRCYCYQGRHKQAVKLIEMLLGCGRTNSHTFGMYFESFRRKAPLEIMIRQWDSWDRRGVEIGPVAASAIVKVCCQRDGDRLAIAALEKCLSRGVRLNVFTFNTLLVHYAKQGDIDEVLDIFNVLRVRQSDDIKPTPLTYSAVLTACAKAQKFGLARLVRSAQFDDNVASDSKLICQYLYVFARGRMVQDAQAVFVEAQERGMVSLYVANALLNVYARSGMWHEAMRLYSCISEDDFLKPDSYTYVAMFSASARGQVSYKQFSFLLDDMKRWKVRLNTFIACALTQSYRCATDLRDTDKFEKGYQVLGWMKADGVPRNTEFYNCLIGMAVEVDSYEITMKFFKLMQDDGIVPDNNTFRQVIQCCREFGQEQKVKELIQFKKMMGLLNIKTNKK